MEILHQRRRFGPASAAAAIAVGAGAPAGACATGDLYLNTTGGAGTTLYVCEAGVWAGK